MNSFNGAVAQLSEALALGGPVIAILLVMSVIALAVVLAKLWQFASMGVGRHRSIRRGLAAWDNGDVDGAHRAFGESKNHIARVIESALGKDESVKPRYEALAEDSLAPLEHNMRLLDLISQIAPLLGLFGTVLGMIEAFRALQAAGSSVDPSILAGGIWVALLTTAAGLAVAMPVSMVLTWLESRIERERQLAASALEAAFHPITAGARYDQAA
ncbi:MotA/TolQ/ExbB proton channel family protein [Paracoccaceae bacterium GXU_MW_L88]